MKTKDTTQETHKKTIQCVQQDSSMEVKASIRDNRTEIPYQRKVKEAIQ